MSMKTTVQEIAANAAAKGTPLLQILLAAQDASDENYLSEEAINEISRVLSISRSRVYSTASFYSVISLKPRGRHIVQVCVNSPCENAGKQEIIFVLENELGISLGQTTSDGYFTLEGVSCLGACYMSPAIRIDQKLFGDLTPSSTLAIIRGYRKVGDCLEHTA